jgi:hypothetical protein
MLVCNVSLRPPRSGIAADLAEAAVASDNAGTGNVVFATLVDDPASVGEIVDAYLGEIMLEAASSGDAWDAGLVYATGIVEAMTCTDSPDATKVAGLTLSIAGTPVTTGTEYEHGVGSTYAGFTATASGGTSPYTYSVAAGTLPSGITLNSSTGVVSGTPGFQTAGAYAGIVIRVTDNLGATADLAAFTLTIAYKDPYYSNVNLLLDYDAADGNAVFTDQKSGGGMTVGGNAQHDTGITPLYGTSTFLFDGSVDQLSFADDARWTIGAVNFTLDFTARPTTVTGTHFWFAHWFNSPQLGWALYQNANAVAFNVSTTGSDNIVQLTSSAGTLVINTWARWRVDFDGTKYRLYKDGTMVASSTTLRTIFNCTEVLSVGNSGASPSNGFVGNCRGVRLTVGSARTASDSGYTVSNRAFPTS